MPPYLKIDGVNHRTAKHMSRGNPERVTPKQNNTEQFIS